MQHGAVSQMNWSRITPLHLLTPTTHAHTHMRRLYLLSLFSLCLFTTPIIITLMTSQWPLQRLSLPCPPPLSQFVAQWDVLTFSRACREWHTNTHTQMILLRGALWGSRSGSSKGLVYSKWSTVCVCAHICVRGKDRKRERERDQRTLFWHSWCLSVLFFSPTPLLFFPPSVLLGAAYWFNIRSELPSGCFSFLCFYRARGT